MHRKNLTACSFSYISLVFYIRAFFIFRGESMTNANPAIGDSNKLTIIPPIKPISFVLAHKAMTSDSPNQIVSIVVI